MRLYADGEMRSYDPHTDQTLLNAQEMADAKLEAQQAQHQAERAQQQAEQAEHKAEKLAAKLRELREGSSLVRIAHLSLAPGTEANAK